MSGGMGKPWVRLGPLTVLLLVWALAGCSLTSRIPLPLPRLGATAAPGDGLTRFYGQRLAWANCGGGFQCATLRVPLDYAHPQRAQIGIAVVRHPAGDAAHRLGSLILNPGGPGGSGVDYARAATDVVSAPVLATYDIVGFDPRGVARSAPVSCVDDRQMDTFVAGDPDPQTAAEQDQVVAEAKLFDAGCQARSGSLLPHVSTRDAARDMDVLRQALGDQRLNYMGKSYGTYLGAIYAELFPTRVGRMVLDGALDPSVGAQQQGRDQAAGFELELRSFLADCAKLGAGCPTGADPVAGEQRIARLFTAVRTKPLPGVGGRQLTEALAQTGIIAALYSTDTWGLLRQALTLAFAGDGRGLMVLSDAYTDRGPDGRYHSNEVAANIAVSCLDQPQVRSVADVQALLPSYREASPLFGAALAWSDLPCAYWPVPPEGKPHAVHAPGAAPILVVGTIRDPATPYRWAQGLAAQLSAALLTYEGDGHTAYRRGSDCVDSAVDAYLLRGAQPAKGLRCQ